MLLKNKKTGEIGNLRPYGEDGKIWVRVDNMSKPEYRYTSLAELNEEWCDYEEPKDYYVINLWGEVSVEDGKYQRPGLSELGLTFETKEEAEKAVKKLKAWKRLRDKGFKFDLWDYDGTNYQEGISTGRILFRVKDYGRIKENDKDLDICFGGGE